MTYGPVLVGVYASTNNWQNLGSSAIINDCPSDSYRRINHEVLLVGFTSTHWIIKNSWSIYWGNYGFAYIPFSKDCGLTRSISELVVQPNSSPTVSGTIQLIIIMVDSYGDGYNGYVFGFKQGTSIV